MHINVITAVFKRNFVSYFASPTGYVFICVFVLLGSVAAFLPDEFFNANLANLDQLNTWFPLIMLVFVPAITMGVWADERRQGTDELLLTIPASDFDIVIGKWKAAAMIYTVALVFSMACNLAILTYLGNPDWGLFFCTYLGYWLVGLALVSVGMVASFLTGNLTVAYVLGAVFCTPLVVLQWAEVAPIPRNVADVLKSFSIGAQFESFGQGVVTLSSVVYFVMIVVTMLYLCIVLIGRRHWTAHLMWVGAFHFAVRAVSLLVIGLSCCFILEQNNSRADLTAEKLSTLSPQTIKLLDSLKPQYPVVIEAFISDDVPEPYVQTRLNLIAILNELQSRAGQKIVVHIHDIAPNTEQSLIAAQRFDIRPQDVWFLSRGTRDRRSIFLGVAMRSGLQSLTLPFIDRGLSVEYELIHALTSVTDSKKKRVGILTTDAPLFGKFDMNTFSQSPPWLIVDALKKQYNVVEVNPAQPITDKFDVLVAVQPSAMGPVEFGNFLDALKHGQPAVIFEDPMPLPMFAGDIPGTGDPRRSPASPMMMMAPRNQPKCDITLLWNFLGIDINDVQAVWQDYNPIRKIRNLPKGFVFVDRGEAANGETAMLSPFEASDPIAAHLQYMLFPFPGAIAKSVTSKLDVKPLVTTCRKPSGFVAVRDIRQAREDAALERAYQKDDGNYNLAVHITGELPPLPASPVAEGETPPRPEPIPVNVVLVADCDLLADGIFEMRSRGNEPGAGINLDFDNVTFVLNAIDAVAGDDRFLDVRNRRPQHRTLVRFDRATDTIRQSIAGRRDDIQKQYDAKRKGEEEKLTEMVKKVEDDYKSRQMNETEVAIKVATEVAAAQKRLDLSREKFSRELSLELEKADVELNESIRAIQGKYKFYAIVFPPIPPLLIGIGVLCYRRIRERERVPASRRRKGN
ncbi:MAG: Gldg family protein [Thermoguttaceae bacterium]